jgi:hypothetical protein
MKKILTPKVVALILAIAGLLLCVTLIIIVAQGPAAADQPPASAALTVLPAPTSTPTYAPPSPTPIPPTPTSTSTPGPGQFALGVYVEISGTGGVGLRVHADPSISAALLFLAYDTEVFQITKGPQRADGHTWWYLTAPYDTARSGWADQEYLKVLQQP